MKLNLCFPNLFSFNGGGFLRKKDTSYPHAYGALENAYAFGLVIVGGMISFKIFIIILSEIIIIYCRSKFWIIYGVIS